METEDKAPKGADKESSLNFYSEELEGGIFQLIISLIQTKTREKNNKKEALNEVINYLETITNKLKEENN